MSDDVPTDQPPPETLFRVSPLIRRALVTGLVAEVLLKAALFAGLAPSLQKNPMVDFCLFHMVGQMVWRGELLDAYRIASLLETELKATGTASFMPWTYPPPFDLLAALLACGPLAISYLLFTGATLASFLCVLHRIAGSSTPLVVLATYPALLMTIACGQNGFLTGTLIGLAALALQRGRAIAGVPLGLMVIKPHLVVAFAVHGVMTRRWRTVMAAVVTAGLVSAVATLMLGPAVWPATMGAAREARVFLVQGLYPLHRMISAYAALRSFGFPAGVAFLGQAVVTLGAMALLVSAIRRSMPASRLLGLTCLATLFISPYAYDYDLPIFGIGLSFLMPDLLRLSRRAELIALLSLSAVGGSGGWYSSIWMRLTNPDSQDNTVTLGADPSKPFFAGLIMLAVAVVIIRVLRRDHGRAVIAAAQGRCHGAGLADLPIGNASSAMVL